MTARWTLVFRCARCRVALVPAQHCEGLAISGQAMFTDEDLAGPCVDPDDGAVVDRHPAIYADVRVAHEERRWWFAE